ncbi:MAG TPA: nuclear transport factor 2 family protein [Polyangiales bacterium]|nr:nuclear transport factor 2 family protein [Polyangiales bacterium]
MDDRTEIEQIAQAIAAAIKGRDAQALTAHLASDFVLRRPGGPAVEAEAFAASVRDQPVEIVSVQLEQLEIDVAGDSAVATGVQTSRARVDGETVDDRQPFVDYFVRRDGRWQLRVALDLSEW